MPSYFITARPNGGTREVHTDLNDALVRIEGVLGHDSGADADLVRAYGRVARVGSSIASLRVGQTLTIERIA